MEEASGAKAGPSAQIQPSNNDLRIDTQPASNSPTLTLPDQGEQSPGVAQEESSSKVPNSPSSAFAALSLGDPSSSTSTFTENHLREVDSATQLVRALDAARKKPKSLIRSTGHRVPVEGPSESHHHHHHHHLISWKTAEFAYRKSSSVGADLPTLARGLFTERIATRDGNERHRIVVRGYDKFFNLGEMPWTKPNSISNYTTAPYVLTFKENGCIIFISALSPSQLVVTSKHSLGSIHGTEVTHAQKAQQWLDRHLSTVGKTKQALAHELWKRNETAAFELCDDTFEEHVLAYTPERSGLHLHGLNSNSAFFTTRSMSEVQHFAQTWGFIPTRWLQVNSLAKLQEITSEIEKTGAWEGEPIEGFVIRTHMPTTNVNIDGVIPPPYAQGQAWFYKVKFDEPYLMYRDWRELTRKMMSQKAEWEKKLHSASHLGTKALQAATTADTIQTPKVGADEMELSKSAHKRLQKQIQKSKLQQEAKERLEAQKAGLLPPDPPQPRSKRPETMLFIQWCYARLYGDASKGVKPQPSLFANLGQNKGIIAMRNMFLQYMDSESGQRELAQLGGVSKCPATVNDVHNDARPFSKTLLAPIAVPGCGKTILAVALQHLFGVGHVQSDDFKKKQGYLSALEKDLRTNANNNNYILFGDKNNHLFQHRDELVDLVDRLSSSRASPSAIEEDKKSKSQTRPEVGRIRTIALAWDLDSLPLNTLHRICASRIEQRGDNHQTLTADKSPDSFAGLKSHETILWRFLESVQPFGSALKGEGGEGYGDAKFDHVIHLKVKDSAEQNLKVVVDQLAPLLGLQVPKEEQIQLALEKALRWKVQAKQQQQTSDAAATQGRRQTKPSVQQKTVPATTLGDDEKLKDKAGLLKAPRYFGLSVELDSRTILDQVLDGTPADDAQSSSATEFYRKARCQGRVNLRPHITLVHSSNLSKPVSDLIAMHPDKEDDGILNPSDQKWRFYTSLLSDPASTTNRVAAADRTFQIQFSKLLYEEGTLLTFPVDRIQPSAQASDEVKRQFSALHRDWTPHITIATCPDVRPFEANRVVQTWKHAERGEQKEEGEQANKIIEFSLPKAPITVEGRVVGMT